MNQILPVTMARLRANLSPFVRFLNPYAQGNDAAAYEALRRLKLDIFSNDCDRTNKTTRK